MPDYTRLMGLDIGKKRIGIALSDPLGITAQGHETYLRQSLEKDADHYNEIIRNYNVSKIIAGLPKTLAGEIGIAAEDILKYCDSLQKHLPVPIVMYDERMTSAHAHRVLDEGNVRHKNRRNAVDMMAATIILSDYMKGEICRDR
ncbi:MAG: Holliday junction resolvase RuvX [Clostridia bacterium]|nr:Holliday junction resolvase RuvX [Clostridia bacterium]